MDPLSIVVASTTLTKLCPQVILSLKVWIGEVSTIDDIVSAFCGEIRCLENTLEALQAKLNEPSMREAVRAVDVTAGGRLWTQVERSMSDCVTTLESLDNILKGLSRPEGNLFRRSVKQFRLSLESGKIATLRQRIVFFTTTLDLPVQMISLYVARWSILCRRFPSFFLHLAECFVFGLIGTVIIQISAGRTAGVEREQSSTHPP